MHKLNSRYVSKTNFSTKNPSFVEKIVTFWTHFGGKGDYIDMWIIKIRERSEIIREGGLQIIRGRVMIFCALKKGGGLHFFSCHFREGHNFLCHNLV